MNKNINYMCYHRFLFMIVKKSLQNETTTTTGFILHTKFTFKTVASKFVMIDHWFTIFLKQSFKIENDKQRESVCWIKKLNVHDFAVVNVLNVLYQIAPFTRPCTSLSSISFSNNFYKFIGVMIEIQLSMS